jgi:hypothetical protein
MNRIRLRNLNWLLLTFMLAASNLPAVAGKGYSSGGGHSYSSHSSSSHSSSSGSSHSYGSGSSGRTSTSTSSSRSSGPSKSFNSGGRSYSSGSGGSESDRHGYSSGKSYSSDSGNKFSSPPPARERSKGSSSSATKAPAKDSSFSFDTAAARARKEETSKSDFTRFKESKSPPTVNSSDRRPSGGTTSLPGGNSRSDYSGRNVYVPDVTVIRTRPARIYNVYSPYYYRPWVTYHDPYNSFFWWWLLDRSLDDRAYWAYHHRYDMDPSRYQALVANNQELEARVAQLEAQQVPRDPTYTPTGLDRDLMYSDHYVSQSYSNRPTRSGSVAFWIFGVPLAIGGAGFFIWLIWFKRWQTAN